MSKIKLKDLEEMLDAKISKLLESRERKEEQDIEIEIENEEPVEVNKTEETPEVDYKALYEAEQAKNKEWEKTWNTRKTPEQPKETKRAGWGK